MTPSDDEPSCCQCGRTPVGSGPDSDELLCDPCHDRADPDPAIQAGAEAWAAYAYVVPTPGVPSPDDIAAFAAGLAAWLDAVDVEALARAACDEHACDSWDELSPIEQDHWKTWAGIIAGGFRALTSRASAIIQ